MTNYLIRHITDSTGHTFVEVIKPRENECYEIVSADSKEDAKQLYRQARLKNGINRFGKGIKNIHKAMQRKDNDYHTGGLKNQPKDGHIDCKPLSIEWGEVYKREVCNK